MRNFSRSLLLVGSIALMGGLAACGDDVTVAPVQTPTPKVTGVSVSPATGQVKVGNSLQLTAAVSADSGATATIAWKTSDATIATVDQTGKVTGIKAGTVGITATATANGSSASGQATINVVANVSNTNIVLNPTALTLTVGGKQAINATVTLDPTLGSSDKTVAWSSSNTAVATVDATGTVTAVSAGTAIITAKSNADTTSTASATVTVRNPVPTSISVQSITVTGNLNQTVNVNNVAGSIDVTLNVDPGENIVSRVEVLLDNKVVCSQQFSAAQNQALAAAAVNAAAAPVPVVCQINTAQFDSAGVVSFFNGQHVLSARAITSTGQQVATPSTNLVFNNVSGFAAAVTTVNANGATTAIDPRTGLGWTGGDVTVTLTPVNFVSGSSTSTVNLFPGTITGLFSKTTSLPFTKNANGTFSATFSAATAWTATNTGIGNYTTPCGAVGFPAPCAEPVGLGASTLTGGAAGSVIILNAAGPAIGNPLGFPALGGLRVDNSAPGVLPANFATALPAFVITPIALTPNPIWVNASTAFAAGKLGVPSQTTLNGQTVDPGVDNVTATFYFGAAGSLTGASGSCNVTGLTQVTTGSQLPETIVSTAYQVRAVFTDALGNKTCSDFANTIGADFTPPTFQIQPGSVGPNAAFPNIGAVPVFAVGASDNASGFGATPLTVSVIRQTPSATECVYGSAAGCINPAAQNLTFNIVSGATAAGATVIGEGYYTTTVTLSDQAGNTTTVVTNQVDLVDGTAPTFGGGISLQPVYTGNQPAVFTTNVADVIDLNQIFGVVSYAAGAFQYPAQQLGSFGLPFETQATVNYTVQQYMRCVNTAAQGFAAMPGNEAQQINLTLSDQAGNFAFANKPLGTNAGTCGAVGDVAINTFIQNAPSNATVSLGAAAATPKSTQLQAIADVPLNTSANPFVRVDFYIFDATSGTYKQIGTSSPLLTQTQTNRTWTYSFTWTPTAAQLPANAVFPFTASVFAVGVDSQGDAVFTGGANVQIVP